VTAVKPAADFAIATILADIAEWPSHKDREGYVIRSVPMYLVLVPLVTKLGFHYVFGGEGRVYCREAQSEIGKRNVTFPQRKAYGPWVRFKNSWQIPSIPLPTMVCVAVGQES
jgi:hypothetical protein